MAARPGEDLAATLFADVHYFYGPASAKPPHHRFDKGSYVYLFENPSQRRARLEIANNAGTADQDAFQGHLDSAHIQYSHRHTTSVTLTVDGPNSRNSNHSDTSEWHLPTFDPKNENKYMYRLHSLDIYFWTKEDALQFVNGVRRVLPQHQIDIQDEPVTPPAHSDAMSSVVQKLETVAITDPSYHNGRTRDSRTTTAAFPGPPTSGPPSNEQASSYNPSPQAVAGPSKEPAAFVPMAYNPAAPAAPEVIQYREKTPPPEDGNENPLVAAAASDQGRAYGTPYQHPAGGFSGPPGQQAYFSGPPAQPIQSPYSQHMQNQFVPPSATSANFPAPPAYRAEPSPHLPNMQFANYPGSPGLPPGTPGIYSPGLISPQLNPNQGYMPSMSQGHNPAAPPGGFAQYSYTQKPGLSNTQPLMNDYSIHSQVYRPTEGEAAVKGKPTKGPTGRLEKGAGSLERVATGFLKKLENKIG